MAGLESKVASLTMKLEVRQKQCETLNQQLEKKKVCEAAGLSLSSCSAGSRRAHRGCCTPRSQGNLKGLENEREQSRQEQQSRVTELEALLKQCRHELAMCAPPPLSPRLRQGVATCHAARPAVHSGDRLHGARHEQAGLHTSWTVLHLHDQGLLVLSAAFCPRPPLLRVAVIRRRRIPSITSDSLLASRLRAPRLSLVAGASLSTRVRFGKTKKNRVSRGGAATAHAGGKRCWISSGHRMRASR